MRSLSRAVTAGIAVVALAAGLAVSPGPSSQSAQALPTGASWDPGFIISDNLFYSGGAMSANEVEGFLQGKGGRIASWTQATPSMASDSYCAAYQGSGGERAADIIAKVGAACNISQRVLLVTLQKEQALVTATSPSDYAINHATGFSCPDSAPCDPRVAGFFYQIYYAARQFQIYRIKPYSFNFRAGQTVAIGYDTPGSVDSAGRPCGAPVVTIRNAATAGLYDYTPYQPNPAALANLKGTGDSCSTYGNRNFWVYWWSWFGDPHGGDPAWVDAIYQDLLGRLPDNPSQSWQNQALLGGQSRDTVVNSLITSPEYRARQVTAAYQSVLGRAPDASGLSYWVGQTPPSGSTWASQISLAFLQSDELWARAGSTSEGWVSLMYESVLGRAPDSEGLIAWSNWVNSSGRAAVLAGIYDSPEAASRRVIGLFQDLLGRSPDAEALSYFCQQDIMFGDEYVSRLLTETFEYISRAQQRFPAVAGIDGLPLPTAPPQPVAGGTAATASSFVTALSQDLLGSSPSGSAMSSMTGQLAAGWTLSTLATNVYQSPAYRTSRVSQAYQVALGRPADSGGLAYWVGNTIIPASQLVGQFLITDEAYANAGGTPSSWITKLATTLLGRAPTSGELSTWATQLTASGRSSVLASVYTSSESRTRRLQAIFPPLLGRAPSSAELSGYGSQLTSYPDEYVGAELIGSVEYQTRAETRFPPPILSAIAQDLLGSSLDSSTLSSWGGALASGTTAYRLAADAYNGTPHRTWAITGVYQSLLGRAPDSAGLTYWLSATAPGGSVRTSTVEEQFLLTDEFYQKAGGTPSGWVSMMYQDELGRTPDASGLAYWASQVAATGRSNVLWGIYNSDESAHLRINALAIALLGRAPTSGEYSHYTPLVKGYGDEYVGAAFIGTTDYAARADARF